ncbi:MAG TPA: hypothetical protein VGX03_22730 [Candidatus Binatia bacterium]|jgi:hypothetical protein|nr:hypothetical protein [Candidatus Binatia bacterium]
MEDRILELPLLAFGSASPSVTGAFCTGCIFASPLFLVVEITYDGPQRFFNLFRAGGRHAEPRFAPVQKRDNRADQVHGHRIVPPRGR